MRGGVVEARAMAETLYSLSSLPSTLSLISPAARRRQQTGDSASLLEAEERQQEKLKQKCDKIEQNSSSPPEKNILSTKNNSVKDKNFLRRLARVSDEVSYSAARGYFYTTDEGVMLLPSVSNASQ